MRSRLVFLGGLAGIAAAALGASSDSTAPATATFTAVSPAPGASSVVTSPTLTLTFGRPLRPGMEQYLDPHQGGIAAATVPMQCAWSPDQSTLTCTTTNPLAAGAQYTIHMGAGMTDTLGHMMDMDPWTTTGGQWATSGMMRATHAGQPINMMGPAWMQGSHSEQLFTFTTS